MFPGAQSCIVIWMLLCMVLVFGIMLHERSAMSGVAQLPQRPVHLQPIVPFPDWWWWDAEGEEDEEEVEPVAEYNASDMQLSRNTFTDTKCCNDEDGESCWRSREPLEQGYLTKQTLADGGWSYAIHQHTDAPPLCYSQRSIIPLELTTSAFSHLNMYGSLEHCIPWLRRHSHFDKPLCDRYRIASSSDEGEPIKLNANTRVLRSVVAENEFDPLQFHIVWTTDHPPRPQLLLLIKSILVVHRTSHVNVRVNLWLYQPREVDPTGEAWKDSIWTDPQSEAVATLLTRKDVTIRIAQFSELSNGTRIHKWVEAMTRGTWRMSDPQHWIDSDLLRLLILYHHGGVYVDADTIVLRSFAHLAEQEFLYQWGTACYMANGALMSFVKHSQSLNRLFDRMLELWPVASVAQNQPRGTDLGVTLYSYVFYSHEQRNNVMPRLGDDEINQFAPLLLPSCFVNPNWHSTDIKYTQGSYASQWNGPFAFHLHGSVWHSHIQENSDYARVRDVIEAAYLML